MKTTQSDLKLVRRHRLAFVIIGVLALIGVGIYAALYVRGSNGTTDAMAAALFVLWIAVGAVIGIATMGAVVAHTYIRQQERKNIRVADGVVDGE